MNTAVSGIAPRQELRALITRPRAEAESLAAALEARGVEALIEPMMELHYRLDTPLDLTGVQAVLCTSANGARALARSSGERDLPLLAVGDATAARARAEGFAAVTSAGGAVGDLVRLAVERLEPNGGRLLHVAGSAVAGDLAGDLRGRGFAVERAVLYEARPVAALSVSAVRALRTGMVDLALFFSPRTAVIFARLAGVAGIAGALAAVTVCSLSPAVDAALGGLSWRGRRVARQPTQGALLAELDRAIAECRHS